MKKRLTVLLALAMALSMILPQSAFADEVTADKEYPYESGIIFWGGPEAVDDTSIKVSWLDLMDCWGYRLSWKPADDAAAEEKSVTLEDTGDDSYTITGLQPDTRYKIKIRGVLKNSEGNLYTKARETYGTTYIAVPKYDSDYPYTSSSCIPLPYKVQEKNGVLKIYRADSAQGPFELIGTTDGMESEESKRAKYGEGKITYKDTTVTPGKTYYYKAKTEVTVGDKVYSSADSEVVTLAAANWFRGSFTAQLLNKKGTYARKLTWKIGSDTGNYKTVIKKAGIRVFSESAKNKTIIRKVTGVEYSFNGKKYYKLKKALTVKPGKTVYLRLTLKTRLWIRRDGLGGTSLNTAYYKRVNENNNRLEGIKSSILMYFDGRADMSYPGEETSDDIYDEYTWLDTFFEDFDGWSWINEASVKVDAINDSGVKLSWQLSPGVDGYVVRYGRTKEEAENSEPIILPVWQVGYTIDGLERNVKYCFLISVKDIESSTVSRFVRLVNRPQPRMTE